MSTQLILGLGNKARHGKDTFAETVINYYANIDAIAGKHLGTYRPHNIQKLSFADALYIEVNRFLVSDQGKRFVNGDRGLVLAEGIIIPDWVTPTDPPAYDSRAPYGKHAKLLQWWGTEYRRNQDPEYWTTKWKAAINPKADIVMATDMRFPNEAEAIKSVHGYTVNVSRLNVDGTPFVDPSRPSDHPSETALDGYNYDYRIVVKTGDQVLLEEYARTLVHFLRARKSK
jgi:hypothetical protein